MSKSWPREYERWDTHVQVPRHGTVWYCKGTERSSELLEREERRDGVRGQGDAAEEKGKVKSLQWRTEEFGLSPE